MTEFKDVEFMTAKEKEKVLKDWTSFLKALQDGPEKARGRFTRDLYSHLTQHCSFIAHYDRGGFFSTYFEDPNETRHFLTQFDPAGEMNSIEYGYNYWRHDKDYEDLNGAMCEVAGRFFGAIVARSHDTARNTAIEEARGLVRTYGLKKEDIFTEG